MNTTHNPFAAHTGAGDADGQQREDRASRYFALGLAVFTVLALAALASLIVSSSVSDVSASARDAAAQSAPQVRYFPSLHVNQASEIEPPPATF